MYDSSVFEMATQNALFHSHILRGIYFPAMRESPVNNGKEVNSPVQHHTIPSCTGGSIPEPLRALLLLQLQQPHLRGPGKR